MQYNTIIIGFGKAGKTLAVALAGEEQKVALFEKSPEMYGGTCINTACIPSKTLIEEAKKHRSFKDAMARKKKVVEALNDKNYHNLADDENVDIITEAATFKDNKTVTTPDNKEYSADNIVINTGSKSNIPDIEGLEDAKNVYDSKGIMELERQPDNLVILGAGYIALEFATLFNQLGTKVTLIDQSKHVLSSEDKNIGTAVYDDFTNSGVEFVSDTETTQVSNSGDTVIIGTSNGTFEADAMLVATGRKPNTDGLGLENTDINLDDDGVAEVNEHLETSVPHIYAVGDVKGGMQFTFVSLDDYRIVHDKISGEAQRTTENRGDIPYTVFIDPPFSRVGMTASAAKKNGHEVLEGKVPVNAIPRHKVDNDERGVFKAVVDQDTDLVLGASLYGSGSEELISIVKLAMDQKIPASVLKNNIYTHPTMAESFNDLFDV